MKKLLYALSLLLCLISAAQPRYVDSTFGTNGKIVTNTSGSYRWLIDMALQSDDKPVLLAVAQYNRRERIVLLRYTAAGTLDASFSGDGIADSLLSGTNARYTPTTLRLQPDGKILVCGSRYAANPGGGFVARYLPNGNLDTTFGNRGLFSLPQITLGNTGYSGLPVNSMALLPNGKLLLLISNTNSEYDIFLTRLNANGVIDSTFGTNGIVVQDVTPSYSPQYSKIVAQADGKILIGGDPNEYQPNGTYHNLGLLRLNATGSIDSTYGTNGQVQLKAGTADHDVFEDMALQPDGQLLVSGLGQDMRGFYDYTFALRLTTNGSVDTGFGTSGTSIIPPTGGSFYSLQAKLALQADGKLLLPGLSRNATSGFNMAVARLNSNGLPDASFDGDGFATLPVNGYDNYALAAMQQTNGGLVLGGLARNNSNSTPSITIGRLTTTGSRDASLNPVAAIASIGSGSGVNDEEGFAVYPQPDGKMIQVDVKDNGVSYDLSLYRRTATGAPDNSFGTNGNTILEIATGYNSTDYFSGLLGNGQLMLGLSFGDYFSQTGVLLLRVNTDGKPDSTFGTNGRLYLKTRNNSNTGNLPQIGFRPDGKIMMLYTQQLDNTGPDSTLLVRLNADGSPDAGFNGNGSRLLAANDTAVYNKLYVQPDSAVLVTESVTTDGPNGSYAVSSLRRITTTGATDAAFNSGNPLRLPLPSEATGFTTQADGKILVYNGYASVLRLHPNGTPDSSFGTTGLVSATAANPAFYKLVSVKEAGSNRLLVAGLANNSPSYNGRGTVVALKPNGTADSSFGYAGSIGIPDVQEPHDGPDAMALQTDGRLLFTGFTLTSGGAIYSSILTRLKAVATGKQYTFTGSGLWSNAANWSDGTVPPTTITPGNSIVIDPPAGGECVINIVVHVQAGASVTVKAGKKLRLPGNLILQ